MKHYGDITKLSGYDLPIVDIVTGGSPCQDLSCAGKRKGLQHSALGDEETTRSGLFMEQIRVIKEMREHDRSIRGTDVPVGLIRPRYMVWENVAGALSSGIPKGGDFRIVLEETAKIADKDAVIPGPPGGKWPYAGCIVSDGWSIAWRLHDSQWFGVPQRRKRICLLADFNGDTAGKVLFELQRETTNRDTEQAIVDIGAESRSEVQSVSKGLSGDIAQSGKEGERVAEDTERCTNPSSYTLKIRGGIAVDSNGHAAGKGPLVQTELSGTLGVSQDQTLIAFESGAASRVGGHTYEDVAGTVRANAGDNQQAVVYGIGSYDSNAMKSDNPHSGIYQADTSRTLDLNGGNPGCNQGGMMVVQGFDGYNQQSTGDVAMPLRNKAADSDHIPVVCIEGNGQRESHKGDGYKESDTMYTLNTVEQHAVCIENHPADSRVKIAEDGICQTLSGRMGTGGGNVPMVMESQEPVVLYNNQNNAGISQNGICNTLPASAGMGGGYVPMVVEQKSLNGNDISDTLVSSLGNAPTGTTQDRLAIVTTYQETTGSLCASGYDKLGTQEAANDMFVVQSSWDGSQVSPTLTANNANGSQRMPDKDNFNAIVQSMEVFHCTTEKDKVQTLKARDYKDPQCVAYGLDRASYNQGENAKYNFSVDEKKVGTCVAKGPNAVCKAVDCLNGREKDVNGTLAANARKSLNSGNVVRCESVVRRLTPMECERLQGFPDNWTNIGDWVDSKGKTHKGESDSPRYKALGNSIALPFWAWMAERMMPHLPENPTMASLFDGIGGFPLVFSRCGCKPVWASEIEEFPIAVTKRRFPDESDS